MSRFATPLSALAVVGASVALAACGSSDGGSGSSTGASAAAAQGSTRSAAQQKFQQCLKDNGVDLPQRGQGGPGAGDGYGPPAGGQPPAGSTATPPAGMPGGGDSGAFRKAMQACAKYRPQGAGAPGGDGRSPRMDIKAFTPYLTCLKDKGLDVKVADGFNALRNLKQDDPKVQAAFTACQAKLPQRSGAGAGGTASSATPGATSS